MTEVVTIISIIKVKINIFLIENINLKRRIGKLAFAKERWGSNPLTQVLRDIAAVMFELSLIKNNIKPAE